MAEALRSPSLAGITHDPENNKRIVPASTRADGSIRKELRVKPGYVAPEEVAKYKVGQGSVRSQLAAAQARGQAPPSPSPAAASTSSLTTPLRPSPSDFAPKDKPKYPTVTPSKTPVAAPSRLGSAASRWATAPPDPVQSPPLGSTSSAATPRGRSSGTRGGRGGRSKSKTRVKRPQVPAKDGLAVPATPDLEDELSAGESESVASEVPEVPSQPDPAPQVPEVPSPTPPASDPLSLSMEWPDTSAGDWWEEDEDLDVRRATKALEGLGIAGPSQEAAVPKAEASQSPPALAKQGPSSPSKGAKAPHKQSQNVNGKGRPPNSNGSGTQSDKRKSSANQPAARVVSQSSAVGDLLSRMEPRTAEQAAAIPVPAVSTALAAGSPEPSSATAVPHLSDASSFDNMTTQDIQARCREISNELRQLSQLRKYEASGAVLTAEQKMRMGQSQALRKELESMRVAVRELADEVEQLAKASQ